MLNSHCNNNNKKKLLKKEKKKKTQLDANTHYTDCKTTVLLTTLRSSMLTIAF